MRRIPPTIASQHPDNAGIPFWNKAGTPFISAYHEIAEAVINYQELGVSEAMWDFEGKHADSAIIERFFSEYHDYFSKEQLGRDKFLTFRIPNIWEEKGYNLLQAMTVILSGEDLAHDLKFAQRPLFEVILPMTERAPQLLKMQELFERLAKFKSQQFTTDRPANNPYIEMIPLVESVESQLGVADLLTDYVKLHDKHFGRKPAYIRVFFACSDSAESSGQLAGIIANKLLVARLYEFEAESGIPVFPFAGPGSLRFRGGFNPNTIDRFLEEYTGVRTVTIQSGFRYDNPKEQVVEAIARLEAEMPKTPKPAYDAKTQARLVAVSQTAAKFYQGTIYDLAEYMRPIFKAVPKRRDRRQHVGLLAYSRSMGEKTLPRAITFTAGFYSVGVPPEFIGLGRTLKTLSPKDLELLQGFYKHLVSDVEAFGRFLNRDNLAELVTRDPAWQAVADDVAGVEAVLGVELGPQTDDEKKHVALSGKLLQTTDQAELADLINQTALLRKSLG